MTRNIRLESLSSCGPAVTPAMAEFYSENCMVCLDHNNHSPGVRMDIECPDTSELAEIGWSGVVSSQTRGAYADREKRVDFGACAIALLLMPEFIGMVAIRASSKGNGIDYYLGPADEDHLIFNNTALLEVSGIQKESASNTVNTRINTKLKRLRDIRASTTSQTQDIPTYVCVVEFGDPRAKVVLA